MLSHRRPHLFRKLLGLALAASLCCAGILVQAAPAPSDDRAGDKVSPDLRAHMERSGRARVNVQLTGPASGRLNAFLLRGGVRLRARRAQEKRDSQA